jgi:hypothetical protein
MFRTDERQSLCDVLAAPDGYRIHSLLVMTYSLDFTALTALLAGLGPQPEASGSDQGVAEVARAIFGLKRRVVVFANNAFIHPGKVTKARRLFSLYDRFMIPVTTEGCAFHPKVWLARFAPFKGGGIPRFRLVCSSRNLTTANTWECGVTLDGVPARTTGEIGPDVARYIRALMRQTSHTGRLAGELAKEVTGVRFEEPTGAWKLAFLGQHPSGRSLWTDVPSPRDGEDAVVVAPFVTGPFLRRLTPRYRNLCVISRQEELDKIANGPGAYGAELKPWLQQNACVVSPEAAAEGGTLDLHAKLLLTRRGKKGVAYVGSANATASAWGTRGPKGLKNWEASIRLDGREVLSDFERHFMYEDEKKRDLRAWLRRYVCKPRTKDQVARDLLGSVQRWFSCMQMRVRWPKESGEIGVRLASVPAGWQTVLRDVAVACAPFGLKDVEASLQDMSPLFERKVLAFTASADERGEFVFVRLRHKARLSCRQDFVMQATVDAPDNWRDERDQAVLKDVVGSRALFALIVGMLTGRSEGVGNGSPRNSGWNRRSASGHGMTEGLLEPLLQAWALDPEQFEDVRAVLDSLGADTEDEELKAARALVQRLAAMRPGTATRQRL